MSTTKKSQRGRACISCSQRKIKCDRIFPCTNCIRVGAQCLPAAQLARRRRRFLERELLERLRHYETLLRQNNIEFEPFHPNEDEHAPPGEDIDPLDDAPSDMSSNQAVDFFHAIGRLSLDSDEDDDDTRDNDHHIRDTLFKSPWTRGSDYLLFFGNPTTSMPLSTSHPDQVQIFKLWQIYLENINPLLKVTHASTLQARIIDAVSNITNISPPLEALMFSIYCVSIMSLAEDKCYILFGRSKDDLLFNYHFACQQALQNCSILQCDNIDCLIALYLYLVSVRAQTDPRSLSAILAVTIRIAKRMKLHDETSHAKCGALEAEMRRRLWWSLILFDHRICEMSDYRDTSLAPTWDCQPPRNHDDLDLRLGMKTAPAIYDKPTDTLFAVVRSELADFIRHSTFHINFINPSLNIIAHPKATRHRSTVMEGDDFVVLEKTIEDKYLAFCNPENLLHFMTIWTTRSALARNRLLQYYSSTSSTPPMDAQRNAAMSCALSMLECDTRMRTHPLTQGFLWFVDMHLPAIAFNHILNSLRDRPEEDWAEQAWDAMSDNYEARVMLPSTDQHRNLVPWIRMVLHVWEIREVSLEGQSNAALETPWIVTSMRGKAKQVNWIEEVPDGAVRGADSIGESQLHLPTDLKCFTDPGLGGYPDIPRQAVMDVDANQFWNLIDWM